MATSLHPAAADLLDELGEHGVPPAHAQTPSGSRAAFERVFLDLVVAEPVAVDAVTDVSVPGPGGGIPTRVYRAGEDGPKPILVHYHGGGWVRGNLDTYDEFCRYLTAELGCVTIAPQYRKAPEHPFPAAVDDCYRALEWAAEHGNVFGGDPDRLGVIGDSAGGNLSTVVSLLSRDLDGPEIELQTLLYPVTNYAFDTNSYAEHADDPILPVEAMEWYWNHYLDRELDGFHPYASPLRARSLADLPPAVVFTAEFDTLRDEGIAYAERLADESGATHVHLEDLFHACHLFPELEPVAELRRRIVAAVDGRL